VWKRFEFELETRFCDGRSRLLGQSSSIAAVDCEGQRVFGVLKMRELDDGMRRRRDGTW